MKGSIMFKALAVGTGVVLGVIAISLFAPERGAGAVTGAIAKAKSETTGSGVMSTIERKVNNFTTLSVSAPVDLTVIQGDREGLTLTGDDNILNEIETIVTDGTLEIKPTTRNWRYYRSNMKGTLYVKQLKKVALSSSGNLKSERLTGDEIIFAVAGSGNMELGDLKAQTVKFSVAGSGNVQVAGAAPNQKISIAGSGNIHTEKLRSENVSVSIAGSGDAKVWATQSITVSVAGSGDVGYFGNPPNVKKSIVGSGNVESLGAAPV
jgi:hypothetical protein